MKGPPPKPSHLRQRRNKVAGAANLPSQEESLENEVPPLPLRADGENWHSMVVMWWDSVWKSPMASEYLDADLQGGLYLLADLHEARWRCDDPNTLVKLAAEIRQQEVRFGLSPIDRSRLRWEIDRGEGAEARVESRRKAKVPPQPEAGSDPRDTLKLA